MATLLTRALDLLYPPRCVACGAFDHSLCPACAAHLIPAHGPGHCPVCGARWPDEGICPSCTSWRSLDGARAAFEMEGPARSVVHGLKFRGSRDLSVHMAAALRPVLDRLRPDAIYPIPLHRRRRRRRGFNQAELLLRRLDAPPAPGRLDRIRATASQVGLSVSERRENVAGAFRYRGPALTGATVAVLDDVVTTGATAHECARVLRGHGAAHVYAVSYARAPFRPRSASSQPLD